MIQGHFDIRLLDVLDRKYKAITFLRDPLDQVVSFFYYLKRHPNDMYVLADDTDIEQVFTSDSANLFENLQVRYLCGKPTEKLDASDLEVAKRNLDEYFSFVGTVETIQRDIEKLGKIFNLSTLALQTLNANNNRPSCDELPESTRRLIIDNNDLDIQLYEYARSQREA